MIALLAACLEPPAAALPISTDVPWNHERAALSGTSPSGRDWRRGIIHLHSIYSHDACDNHETPDDVCFASFRSALCNAAIDYAFVTDHPAMAAEHPYEDLLLTQPGDDVIDGVGNLIHCDRGHDVLTLPGIEDELMPVGLLRHVADSPEENDRIYNGHDAETFDAEIAAGAMVVQAHTEGKSLEDLIARQALGLRGVEMFNLHAMVDPNKREADLGLDPFSYLEAIGVFVTGDTLAEPDLAFLAFYEEQGVSLEKWDTLNRTAFTVGTAGTDAHENAIPSLMSDGERVDSYRRMMSWFSNVLLVDGDAPADHAAALHAGRNFMAFEALGTPADFDVSYVVDETTLEMGGEAATGGTLRVTCPILAATSPQMGEPPEVAVTVFKDGEPYESDCGDLSITEPGVYRARADIVPHHLAGFLDTEAEALIHAYPWLYSNAFRIGF